ncbi:MAG: hypothetical protein ACLTH3_11120 [Lachnospira sp.]
MAQTDSEITEALINLCGKCSAACGTGSTTDARTKPEVQQYAVVCMRMGKAVLAVVDNGNGFAGIW